MYRVCQARGPTKKKRRKQEHGKENLEEGQEARSHQAVDDFRQSKQIPAVNLLLVEPSGHTKTGGNKKMAKKTLKKAKKLEATKPLTTFVR
jgi:poly(3-hydroxybutyrate) depolymerase